MLKVKLSGLTPLPCPKCPCLGYDITNWVQEKEKTIVQSSRLK